MATPSQLAQTSQELPGPKELIEFSRQAEKYSYSPYSKFTVGAALLCKDGTVYKGCNVESVSLSICAERTAIVKAVSEGRREFLAIAVSASKCDDFINPCGNCRQFMTEFGLDWTVYMSKPDGTYVQATVSELLPRAFVKNHLKLN